MDVGPYWNRDESGGIHTFDFKVSAPCGPLISLPRLCIVAQRLQGGQCALLGPFIKRYPVAPLSPLLFFFPGIDIDKMTDPISLTTAALAFIGVVITTTRTAYININQCREINETLAAVRKDGMELSKVLTVFDSVSDEAGLLSGSSSQHWAGVKSSLFDLAKTMNALQHLLKDIQDTEMGIISNPIKVFKYDAKADEIETLRKRIAGLSLSIQLSIQFITLYPPLRWL
jgi:hypothetical protein